LSLWPCTPSPEQHAPPTSWICVIILVAPTFFSFRGFSLTILTKTRVLTPPFSAPYYLFFPQTFSFIAGVRYANSNPSFLFFPSGLYIPSMCFWRTPFLSSSYFSHCDGSWPLFCRFLGGSSLGVLLLFPYTPSLDNVPQSSKRVNFPCPGPIFFIDNPPNRF